MTHAQSMKKTRPRATAALLGAKVPSKISKCDPWDPWREAWEGVLNGRRERDREDDPRIVDLPFVEVAAAGEVDDGGHGAEAELEEGGWNGFVGRMSGVVERMEDARWRSELEDEGSSKLFGRDSASSSPSSSSSLAKVSTTASSSSAGTDI